MSAIRNSVNRDSLSHVVTVTTWDVLSRLVNL
jgi:hypothetical protein